MYRDEFTKAFLLSLQRALLGAIRPNHRAICYRIHSRREATLRCYCSEEPNEDDYEAIDVAATELHADFPSLERVNIECIYSTEPIGYLDVLDGNVFSRQEESDLRATDE